MCSLPGLVLLALSILAGATLAAEDCDPKVPEISSNAFDDWAGHGNWLPEDEPRDDHIFVYCKSETTVFIECVLLTSASLYPMV